MTANLPADHSAQVDRIVRYLDQNRGKFTEDALAQAVRAEGYPEAAVTEGIARYRAIEAAAPSRANTRRIVLWAYLVTFVALSALMLVNGTEGGIAILAPSLGIAAGLSVVMLNNRRLQSPAAQATLAALVGIPVLLLVAVAGICLASGVPFQAQYL